MSQFQSRQTLKHSLCTSKVLATFTQQTHPVLRQHVPHSRTQADHVVLPEIISKEPLGPLVRHGDSEWGDVVRWSLNALIAAEELGVTSANIGEMSALLATTQRSTVSSVQKAHWAKCSACDADWAKKAIMAGGNYGEIFEKNIGENTPIGLGRGLNAQWTDGGLLYVPPFR